MEKHELFFVVNTWRALIDTMDFLFYIVHLWFNIPLTEVFVERLDKKIIVRWDKPKKQNINQKSSD